MFQGYVVFGSNDDGYGDYNVGTIADVKTEYADNADDALMLVAKIAREYCERLQEEEDYEMPYPWNWGDILEEVPEEFLTERGVTFSYVGSCTIFPHNEIVVSD